MTNLSTVNEPAAGSADTAPVASRLPARKARTGWRALLPTMTPWLGIGLFLVVSIALFGLIGPYLVGDPSEIRDIGLTPPSGEFVLGTTQTGQDVFAQL